MKRIGIFGGSFNPPHVGHIALAEAIVKADLVDEVWMVLSPLNPFKQTDGSLAPDSDRMAMLRLAVDGHPSLKASDIELTMPRPNYTINTMERLRALNPDCRFRLIIGQDNWQAFDRWRDADTLRRLYSPIVYRRAGADGRTGDIVGAETLSDAPLLPVSSTQIRERIACGLPVNNMVPPAVYRYIREHHLYGA